MDRTVPAGAARLLDFIRDTEVGTESPSGYDVIFGHNQGKLHKPVTSMTVDEVLGAQASWSSRFGSSATGGYQFMRKTLAGLKDELGLRGSQILDANLQDRLGYHLLLRRGYDRFVAGQIDRTEFAKRLAQEWASFPVLVAVRGGSRQVSRGQSYYAGDGLNKALVKPEQIEALLDEVAELARETASAPIARPEEDVYVPLPAPAPAPQPAPSVPVATSRFDPARFSKLFGSLIGALVTWSVANQFIPDGTISPQMIDTFAAIIGGVLGTYFAPANAVKPAA
ncbi:hypothetical protein [Aureimonas sp. AU4]|uniref:hypothetical protein n=1 Tax=Aureimonas sp. AU4 TaxID=1638163 RepID=UPI000780E3EA|nr:hypothetical protein [Aureimonas sp. AU4]